MTQNMSASAKARAIECLAKAETGMTLRQIGDGLGLSPQRVSQLVRTVSTADSKRRTRAGSLLVAEQNIMLKRLVSDGLSRRKIAESLGLNKNVVAGRLHRMRKKEENSR